jgi:hypothetical protein
VIYSAKLGLFVTAFNWTVLDYFVWL